jgi:hypothetical protein
LDIESDGNIEGTEEKKTKKTAKERFFATDARSWPKVCELGMPAAVSYLVLACGSGGDQTTTGWSVDAITRHTGIGRPRAKQAIEALVKAGLITIEKGGTRPRYSIIHEHKRVQTPTPLTEEEQRILGIIVKGNSSVPKVGRRDNVWQWGSPYATALDLVKKGYLRNLGNYRFATLEKQAPPEDPDLIWLPSNLVDSEGKSVTPVERVRQSQNVAALRLFIGFYHQHDLINEQGINWRRPHGLRYEYERIRLGQRGERVIWGFKPKTLSVWPDAPVAKPYYNSGNQENPLGDFWRALEILTSLHLVERIPYLVDGDSEHGEVMWPIPMGRVGEDCEQAVGSAAAKLAQLQLTPGQLQFANEQGIQLMTPALKHMGEVQAIGIYRLRHRPHTEATKIWLATLTEQCKGTLERFQELIAEIEIEATLSKHATSR